MFAALKTSLSGNILFSTNLYWSPFHFVKAAHIIEDFQQAELRV